MAAVLAPRVLHLPIIIQASLGQGQWLCVRQELWVMEVRVGMVWGWGALRRGKRRERWHGGQVQDTAWELLQVLGFEHVG